MSNDSAQLDNDTSVDAPSESVACEGELIPAPRRNLRGGRVPGYRQPERMRSRIQCGQLIRRLQIISKGRADGTPAHLAVQVQAAKVLLAKALPDIQNITISGDADAPLIILTRME
jgi:hypothetical protein